VAYYCIKRISGRRYIYLQRTYRRDGRVCTESKYVRPLDPSWPVAIRKVFHGSPKADIIRREGFKLLPPAERRMASAYGDGIYFTTRKSGAYDNSRTGANTIEAYISASLKLYPAYDRDAGSINTKSLTEDGYDGVEVFLPSGERHITIFDPSSILVLKV
jgi:hypothetical protein